ncbi:hypothetical protein TSOC_012021 [Tetrabaena socialis]|uniref:Uncharacterized protein n=1 Tax=Tetrabaena socialis TaxID=47790 RepID=A0A2J7ZP67_9CHLO|nr:hypothetical protein TSOC_012021 [Tetrabaena socialis]|eukprot:PNH02064.1 hypothetical protein TSOC_012021 [Tetrabaena socialis]
MRLRYFPNGITYWGWQASPISGLGLGDESQDTKCRTLLRFDDAHRYVPPTAVVTAAELSVTFVNWNQPLLVQACYLTRLWRHQLMGSEDRFSSTGWAYSQWNGTASVPWSAPGGWADCSPNINISFVVPANGINGYWTQTIPLDPGMVSSWLTANGSANYGLMFRCGGWLLWAGALWAEDRDGPYS